MTQFVSNIPNTYELRFDVELTSVDYVTREAWREARLDHCPRHPQGGCGFARHGTYERVNPPGTRIARWYCPTDRITFSLLPDCLAARYTGTLIEFEAAVEHSLSAPSLEAAADCRADVELPGALRWLRRRRRQLHTLLTLLRGLMPDRFALCAPQLAVFRALLGVEWVLPVLRVIAAAHLQRLPPPLGFSPPGWRGGEPRHRTQHRAGPDPPLIDA